MKILLLSDIASEHTEKWALGLAKMNIKVGLFSFNKATYQWYKDNANISLLFEAEISLNTESNISKIVYIKYVNKLKSVIDNFKPDILHAHYATSYGLIGALSGFHPYVISAWGTDVMRFPQKNAINRSVLKFNLRKADLICATSYTIKEYLAPVTTKNVEVIPFGVDITVFDTKKTKSIFGKEDFVIGCIKCLEEIYNIDVLINAFYLLKKKYPANKLKLMIVGVGSKDADLKKLVNELALSGDVVFTGRIPFAEVSEYFNMIDVFVNVSNYESFGVSVIEAMACRIPVVASNTGGLKEIIESDEYGTLVEVGNIQQTASAIEKYYLNENLRKETGERAREKVIKKYSWELNVTQMIQAYSNLLKSN